MKLVRGGGGIRPVAVDLFAGAGGLSLGFEQAGFDVVAAVEFDPIHAATHELNFPTSKVICKSVRDVTGAEIRKAAGIGQRAIDVVFGGPPCQGFSLIGQRILDDPRNNLVFHFLRLVTELKPKIFVMENVAGMVTGAHVQFVQELVERFNNAGYKVRLPYRTLNARSFGVPQVRERLFLMGARGDARLPGYPVPTTRPRVGKGKELSFEFDALPLGPSVADAIGDLPNIDEYEALLDTDELPVKLGGGTDYSRRLRGELVDPLDFSYPREHAPNRLTGCQRAVHTDLSRKRFAATEPGSTEPISRFFKLSMDGTCNTLRAGTASERGAFTAPRPIHPLHPRCISVREAARLHSYPDWFRFHRTIWHGFRQIGNSVPPLLGRAVASQVIAALGVTPVRPSQSVQLRTDERASFNMKEAAAHFGVSPTVIAPRRRVAAAAS